MLESDLRAYEMELYRWKVGLYDLFDLLQSLDSELVACNEQLLEAQLVIYSF